VVCVCVCAVHVLRTLCCGAAWRGTVWCGICLLF
jgi:hypothetical protein